MTVKEFSDKYHVDYATVYNATWMIKPINNRIRGRQYDEEELRQAVISNCINRMERLRHEMNRAEQVIMKCSL